jgi:L-aspartate semialdehyde sulfurtransferase
MGYVTWHGTQHRPAVTRAPNGTPERPAGTLWVMGDLKQMSPRWLVGSAYRAMAAPWRWDLGVPIPILDEEMARFTGVSDEELFTQVVDYGEDYPATASRKAWPGSVMPNSKAGHHRRGHTIPTVPLSSMVRAREIAQTLKEWIQAGTFLLGEPQFTLPMETV